MHFLTAKKAQKLLGQICCGLFTCSLLLATLKVKIFVQWPFGDQLFGFSCQGKFLGAKLY